MMPCLKNPVRWFATALALLAATGAFLGSRAAAQDSVWAPEKTLVFVVGTLEWKHSDVYCPFPVKNRRDARLVDHFRQWGVPRSRIVYLQDKDATLEKVRASFKEHLAKGGEGDLVFVYYCGHGRKDDAGRTFFATYDTGDKGVEGWPVNSIVEDIEANFKGVRAVLTADCCYSGSLCETVQKPDRRISYACLASSCASQSSTGNWTFTEGLLAGLTGRAQADLDGDRKVTLAEVAELIKQDMAFGDEQMASFVATGKFAPETVLATAEEKSGRDVGRRIEVKWEGSWYRAQIVEAKDGELKVHYYGWDETYDEWVTANRIREPQKTEYAAGASVDVEWKGKWYPAEVLKVENGIHLIHYVDYDSSWDEWAGPKRIRHRRR
jgi:hypothetical protein